MLGLSKKTREYLEEACKDPNLFVREDGTVWRKIGTADKTGAAFVGFSTAKTRNRGVSIPTRYLVYRVLIGEIPENKRVINLDGNANNNHPDNLALIGLQEYHVSRRGWKNLTFQEALDIKREYQEGLKEGQLDAVVINQLAIKYKVARSAIQHILNDAWTNGKDKE